MTQIHVPKSSRRQITLKEDSFVGVSATGTYDKERMGKVSFFVNPDQHKQTIILMPGQYLRSRNMLSPKKSKVVVTTNCTAEAILYVSEKNLVTQSSVPGEGKTREITINEAQLFGRTLILSDNFFTNWRNVYRHPIIWFLSK